MDSNDDKILEMWVVDPEKGMEMLFHHYHSRLCQYAYSYLKDIHAARDVVQELMMDIWNSRDKISIHSNLEAYLKKSLYFKIIRKKKYSIHHSDIEDHPGVSAEDYAQIELKELKELVDKSILDLPKRARQCFLMSRDEDMTYQEIADALNLSPKTVDHHISKALKLLRAAIKKCFLFAFV